MRDYEPLPEAKRTTAASGPERTRDGRIFLQDDTESGSGQQSNRNMLFENGKTGGAHWNGRRVVRKIQRRSLKTHQKQETAKDEGTKKISEKERYRSGEKSRALRGSRSKITQVNVSIHRGCGTALLQGMI